MNKKLNFLIKNKNYSIFFQNNKSIKLENNNDLNILINKSFNINFLNNKKKYNYIFINTKLKNYLFINKLNIKHKLYVNIKKNLLSITRGYCIILNIIGLGFNVTI